MALSFAQYILFSALLAVAYAQSNTSQTVWCSVVVTRNGDSTPLISNELTTLTPLGALQLNSAGALFRNRYIAVTDTSIDGSFPINGLSTYSIDNTQTFALSLLDEYVTASAQAFMQGLYPPLNTSYPDPGAPLVTPASLLADGSYVNNPLGGYQYPQLYSTSLVDPNSIWLAGQSDCSGFLASGSEYFDTPEYAATAAATEDLYAGVATSVFSNELPASDINYHNAYYIWDFINYGVTHNGSFPNISESDLGQFRTLADQWEFAINGNASASGYTQGDRIRTIAGQTLAAEILGLFLNNIQNNGTVSMLNLMFTTFDPMISIASLMGLPNLYTDFFGLPDLGSSMVFELFSETNSLTSSAFPTNNADLQVRFLFRNGTTSNNNLDLYPIFGNGESSMSMSFDTFTTAVEGIMTSTIGEWCQVCQSESVFCPAYTNSTSSDTQSGSTSAMKPAIAGVIGAIIALVIAVMLLALTMLLFGIRFEKRTTPQRRSQLGGFKGAEKMASDPDLTILKRGAGATVISNDATQSHERIGSWELGEASKAKDFGSLPGSGGAERRPSFENDGLSIHGEPVKVDERV